MPTTMMLLLPTKTIKNNKKGDYIYETLAAYQRVLLVIRKNEPRQEERALYIVVVLQSGSNGGIKEMHGQWKW